MIIELFDGTRIDLEETYRIKRLFHRIPSLDVYNNSEFIPGRGDITVSAGFNRRIIEVEFLYNVDSIYGYYLLRDELNALFTQDRPYYIIFKREMYKKYRVRLASQFLIEPSPNMNSFTVRFLMQDNFAKSLGTSLQLQNTSGWDDNIWGFGSGIDYDTQYNYTFNSSRFDVINIGNQTVDPRESDLTIRVRGNFNNFVRLNNTRTGDSYEFTGNLTNADVLTLRNVETFRNNIPSFSVTNRKLITLSPGENIFTVEGGTVQEITFDFNFLYK